LMNLHFFMFVGLDYNIGVFLQLPNFLMGWVFLSMATS
jgi:hypothetical protein